LDILQFKKANCKNCFKCLRECAVKAIAIKNEQAEIIKDDCLLCGHCLTVCPQNAKEARIDTQQVRQMIKSGKKVIASVAPSFIAGFDVTDLHEFEQKLIHLGFSAATETSCGAKVVANEYQRILSEGKFPNMVSSSCPTIIKLMEKYYPQVLKYLAPVLSPMTAHARMLKKQYGDDIYVVFIGPCLCKKDEAEWEKDAVDCVITFEELQSWFEEDGLSFSSDYAAGACSDKEEARLFPVKGGILRTMTERLPDICYVSVDGIEKCRKALEELSEGNLNGYFIEMSACEGSCINGPCMTKSKGGYLAAQNKVEIFANSSLKITPELQNISIDLSRKFSIKFNNWEIPGEKALRQILAKTGKNLPEQELNCGACGYSTCRDKAIAVYQGKAEVTMCMPYMRERAEYISDKVIAFTPNAIVALDSSLNIQALNEAACKMFGVTDARKFSGKYIGELTDPEVFEEAVVLKENILSRRSYLFRYHVNVEQSVIYVKQHNFVFGIFKDMTEVEHQNDKLKKVKLDTIETADKVIEKQMRVVQQIAMLLGETTAETKVALTKLKDTIMSEEE
jgi:iron only hydrogenase large subunit-like protein/uncharacterized Fe-S cluster-containing protein